MPFTRSSLVVALFAPVLACGCFALFSLDDYGPNRGTIADDAATDETGVADASDGGDAKGPRIVFVTSGRFNGSLGGIGGADNRCNAAAADAGLPGSYVAWLGTGVNDGPAARIPDPSRAIVLADANRSPVAGNLSELAVAGPRARLSVTERGEPLGAKACNEDHVWTNARADGTVPDAGFDCDAWSSVSGGGGAGQLGGAQGEWTTGCFARACETQGHLYCFEK